MINRKRHAQLAEGFGFIGLLGCFASAGIGKLLYGDPNAVFDGREPFKAISLASCFAFLFAIFVLATTLVMRDFHAQGRKWYHPLMLSLGMLTFVGVSACSMLVIMGY